MGFFCQIWAKYRQILSHPVKFCWNLVRSSQIPLKSCQIRPYPAKFSQIKTHLLKSSPISSNPSQTMADLHKTWSNPVKYMRIQTNPDQTESILVQFCQILSNSNPNPNPVKPSQTQIQIQSNPNKELDLDLIGFGFGASLTTTDYIVSCMGPYFADCKNNDAEITKHIMYNNKENVEE